ncbi:MAG: DUF2461 domain-containing protein [Chloroflexales bacterium]|nr:DUF2461 domain-containing protein [Chloroflexales bacterium]
MSLQVTLAFLEQLSANNEKQWFAEHRTQYEQAREAFENVIAEVIARFHAVDDLGSLAPKDAIHRIHRDVRFSKDKSPYNTAMSALIGPAGRKSLGRAYFIRVAPHNQSVASAGAIALSGPELQTVRQHLAEHAQPLRTIMAAAAFQCCFGTLRGAQVKGAPNGFPKDHPNIDLLRYKEFIAEHSFSDQDVLQDDFAAQVIAVCQVAKPLTLYFDALLGARVKPEHPRH